MKRQTGVRVEAEVWGAYRAVCTREKLRPSLPIEEFLRLVLENDSASSLLSMMRGMAKARAEGFEAYARVLLDWYTHEKFWFQVGEDEEASVEALLLDSLKVVADSELRRRIEEALVAQQRKRYLEKRGGSEVEKTGVEMPKVDGGTKRVEDSKNVKGEESNTEKIQEKLNEVKRLRALAEPAKESE